MGEYEVRINGDDLKRIAELGGLSDALFGAGDPEDLAEPGSPVGGDDAAASLLEEMAIAALHRSGDEFARFAYENRGRIRTAAQWNDDVVEMLVLGYRLGATAGSGACVNDLGALYYLGDLVEQDYEKAAELYREAADRGCYQSVVNLGYIYEYGRLGEPDHGKAYRCFALAAALAPSSEAICKLGDMYARGHGVERDVRVAFSLWNRSLDLANNAAETAQPALRIAQLLIDPEGERVGIGPSPLRALELFGRAEVGLRIEIENGLTYYRKRLEEAIEGQAKARALLDS